MNLQMSARVVLFITTIFYVVPTVWAEARPNPKLQRRFYILSGAEQAKTFLARGSKLKSVMPNMYVIDKDGSARSNLNAELIAFSKKHGIKIMPFVVNSGFGSEPLEALMKDSDRLASTLKYLIDECKKHEFEGIQIEFEGIHRSKKDDLSKFVELASAAFHEEGLKLSVAVIPNAGEIDMPYSKWIHENWKDAYDIKRLAAAADFITLMAYDQHTRLTPPGPIAGMPWVKKVLKNVLKDAPKEKISLGIPLYGRRWIPLPPPQKVKTEAWPLLSFEDSMKIAAEKKAEVKWDLTEKAPWFWFYTDQGIREYVHFIDAKAYRALESLAREEKLHSVSVFALTQEDPALWELWNKD